MGILDELMGIIRRKLEREPEKPSQEEKTASQKPSQEEKPAAVQKYDPADSAGPPRNRASAATKISGPHIESGVGGNPPAYFVDEERGIRKLLVDSKRNIQNFPGVLEEEFWTKEIGPRALEPRICYGSKYRKWIDQWIMTWTVQPDGWYYADEDGFGAEDDLEVILYALIDQNGDFTGPFRIYQLGSRRYTLDHFYMGYQNVYYDRALAGLRAGSLEESEDLLFPYALCSRVRSFGYRMEKYYSFDRLQEAEEFWKVPLFAQRLKEASQLLLQIDKPIREIVKSPYDQTIQSCMTIFSRITGEPIFGQVLDKFYNGEPEKITVEHFL